MRIRQVTGNRQQATGYRLFFACSLQLVACSYCFAQIISSTELINNAKQYDGKTIVYQGEVVGDIMVRKNYAWINLLNEKTAIGVWLKKDILPDIKFSGGYHQRGDLLEVEGIFQANCPEHGGDLDIHVQKIKTLEEGYKILERVSYTKKIWARIFSLSALFLLVCIVIRKVRSRWKRK